MADNMTPEELAREAAALAEAVKNGTANTKEWNDRIANMSLQAKRAAEDLKTSLNGLGKSAANLAGQMAQGAKGASIYNDAIGAGADVAGKALKMLFPKAALLGKALGLVVSAAGAYFKAANKQADALFKSYNDFNKIGAATSGGMRDIIGSLHQFGYTMADLDKMVALVAANSETLSKFGGTVGQGTKRFAALSNEIVKSDLGRQLMLAGQLPDDINKGVALFLKQQAMLGRARQLSDEQLIRRAFDLSKEFDILRRITGDTIEQQEQKQEELLMSDVGGSIIADLEEKNLTAQAQALKGFQQILPKEFRDKLIAVAGNPALAPEMLQAFPRLTKELQLVAKGQSQATTEDLRKLYIEEAAGAERRFRQQGRVGMARDIFGGEILGRLRKEGGADPEAMAKATADFEAGVESNTERMVDMTRAQITTTQAMEKLVNYGVTPATIAMKAFAELTAKVAGITLPTPKGGPYTTGGGPGGAGAPGAAPVAGAVTAGRMVMGSAEARSQAEQYLGKKMSDAEYSALIKATHAEASAGRGNQTEQAGIMASILNRARSHPGGVLGALQQPNQFQAVTGTKYQPGPSREFLRGPTEDRLKSIEGAVSLLPQISREQKNFTAANAAAYGPGTNIGYRNQMLGKGGTVVGGTVFNTPLPTTAAPKSGFDLKLTEMDTRTKLGNASPQKVEQTNPQAKSFSEDIERRKIALAEEQLAISRRQLAAQEKVAKSM